MTTTQRDLAWVGFVLAASFVLADAVTAPANELAGAEGEAAPATAIASEKDGARTDGTLDMAMANRRAYEKISQALAKPAKFAFDKASLSDVAARLEDELGVPVRIDRRAIADAGIDEEESRITFRQAEVSARSALDMILYEANLAWTVRHETLWITTADVADSTIETRVYDISERDEFGEFVHEDTEALIELITASVKPTTWSVVGGHGDVRPYATSDMFVLVVSQSHSAHEEIERLLANLSAARQPGAAAEQGSARPPRRTSNGEEEPSQESSLPSDANREAVVRGSNELAFDLYRDFTKENEKNCFFSPYSVATALAMVRGGASGETGKEIDAALHVGSHDGDLHAGFGSLQAALRGDVESRGRELRIANRLWTQTNLPIEAPFLATLWEKYRSETGSVDFAANPDAARQAINAWVADRTSDRIRDLMGPDSIHSLTRTVLVNAVYFNGKWTYPFDVADTKPLPFDAAVGRIRVPTMTMVEKLPYAESEGVQAVALEYGSHELEEPAAMLILLPRQEKRTLADLEKSLSADYVDKFFGRLKPQEVKLYLPKFTLTDRFELSGPLNRLGVRRAFDMERAEFGGITKDGPLFLDQVVHQAYVRVDEKGTEAAAATGVIGGFGGVAPPPRRVVFRADHPFVFLIYDQRTRSILFLGRVMTPWDE